MARDLCAKGSAARACVMTIEREHCSTCDCYGEPARSGFNCLSHLPSGIHTRAADGIIQESHDFHFTIQKLFNTVNIKR